ncbi:hypothetical protein QBC47DRAFT_451643 [Echria macrotheca]|uniref:LCCL domain-containing protein n=1 Tax=Echria macrotheca TaxID=438768 RepID=A0AAJ0BJW9_9PEZI|nr:hypothetical protein QBC47DRAFT_451643 [Echria macrotheca]
MTSLPSDADEEAQLLSGEEFDQFELDEISQRSPSNRASHEPLERDVPPLHWDDQPHQSRKTLKIKPLFPSVQESPIRLLDRVIPSGWERNVGLVIFLAIWTAVFALLLAREKGAVTNSEGNPVRQLVCNDSLWLPRNDCGLDGLQCRPFLNTSFSFRCPAKCAHTPEPTQHYVGPLNITSQTPVIGGPIYRGDSYICSAAIHAGVVDNSNGGLGVVKLVGHYYGYFSSHQHGVESFAFDSHFPLSFSVSNDTTIRSSNHLRGLLLAVSLFCSITLSMFTTSPLTLFLTTFVAIFAHVALITEAPAVTGLSDTILPQLVSLCAERLLPSLSCAALIYLVCVRSALVDLRAQVEKTMYWLGMAWIGALVGPKLPELSGDSRAAMWLLYFGGILLALGFLCTVTLLPRISPYSPGQLRFAIWGYSALFVALAGLKLGLPFWNMELRIPGYLIALALLPMTGTQTRLSLIVQGLLLGLFLRHVASLGLESIIRPAPLRFSEWPLPEVVPPLIYTPESGNWTISFKWAALSTEQVTEQAVSGISVLVNDVERYRSCWADRGRPETFDYSVDYEDAEVFTWIKTRGGGVGKTPEYFRFGFAGPAGRTVEYTEAGTWFANGSWSQGAGYY